MVAAVLATLSVAFCLYWFNPQIEADREWGNLADETLRESEDARTIAERNGLNSDAETAALAKAQRILFVDLCVSTKFKYNETSISDYRAIENGCRLQLLARMLS